MFEPPETADTIAYGVGQALLRSLWLLLILIPPLIFHLPIWWIAQLAMLVPLIFTFRDNGQREAIKGVVIVAALGLLINGGCDARMFFPSH